MSRINGNTPPPVDAEYEEVKHEHIEPKALAVIARAEIDMQIATAKQYPRSVKEFHRKALELATLDEDTAGSCFYKLPRGGKMIEGPSVRLAEIVLHAWGNIRAQTRVIATDDKFITAQAECFDLESNSAVRSETKRRITKKDGKRYDDDMIAVASNAACSIALREAVFKCVPRSLVKLIYDAAKRTAIGDAQTLADRRARALEWLVKAGVDKPRILKKLGRAGEQDITLDDLETLRGIVTSIRDGEITADAAFAEEVEAAATNGKADFNATLKARREAKQPKAESPGPAVTGAEGPTFATREVTEDEMAADELAQQEVEARS